MLGAPKVFLTDVECILPALKRNMQRNSTALSNCNSTYVGFIDNEDQEETEDNTSCIRVVPYNFGEAVPLGSLLDRHRPFDIIVGTDILYKKELVVSVIQSLEIFSDKNTEIFIAYELRCDQTHAFLLEQLKERGFSCNSISRHRREAQDSDSEYVEIYSIARNV